MNNLNSVLIEGTLVKDAVTGAAPQGKAVCAFTIESSRYRKGDAGIEKETGHFDVQAFGKLAERARSLALDGRGVRVVGRLQQEFIDQDCTTPHSRIIIVAEHIEYRPDDFKADEAEQEET